MKPKEINQVFSMLKHLQYLNTNYMYKTYEKMYRSVYKMFTKESSVSVSFRISLNRDYDLFKITPDQRKNINKNMIKYIEANNPINEILNLDLTERYLKNNLTDYINSLDLNKSEDTLYSKHDKKLIKYEDLFVVEILLAKRAISLRDKFSGNIAFPGGKFEKDDKTSLATSIRETHEEIGISLNSNYPIFSRYIGENLNLDLTLDLKYYVGSHIFLIIDLFRELEGHLKLNKHEISDVVMVPLSYFFKVSENPEQYKKVIESKIPYFGYVKHDKMILNNDENYLLYGMTLWVILDLLPAVILKASC